MTIQTNDFSARIARIEAGGLHTKHTLFVGSDEPFVLKRDVTRSAKAMSSGVFNVIYPLTMVAAFASGMFSFAVVKALRFHLAQDKPLPGDGLNDFVVMLMLSVGVAFALGRWLWQDPKTLRNLQVFGALLMALGWHNLVHLAPSLSSLIFSDLWTAQTLSGTAYRTLIIRDIVIPF